MPKRSAARDVQFFRRSEEVADVAQSHSISFPYESTHVHVLDAQRALV
jgi:hypothetical protein